MGWDAYATPFKGVWAHQLGPNVRNDDPRVGDREYDAAVEAALKDRSVNNVVDGLLAYGGLDCSSCAYALQLATGESVWDEPWSPEKVTELAAKADWHQPWPLSQEWAWR